MDTLSTGPTLISQAYDAILAAICEGGLQPGERLNQDQLAARLRISRQPVGQALSILKAQGFVRDTGRRGLIVAPLEREFFSAIYQLREALAVEDYRFQPEEKIRFRQPSLSDMIYRLGAGLAGRRHFRGRVVLVSGRRESDRIFTVAALNDILLGHPLDPDLRLSIGSIRGGVTVAAENPTPHASLVSRISNWVEVDLPGGEIVDVKPGGFDRYEVFGPEGTPVTLRRGVRLRFFETLVGPFEKIEPATILMRHPPADGCCAHRIHVASSTGAEVAPVA